MWAKQTQIQRQQSVGGLQPPIASPLSAASEQTVVKGTTHTHATVATANTTFRCSPEA